MEQIVKKLQSIGLSEKAARFYLASWEIGQGSILDISKRAKLHRTSLYYTLNELLDLGAVVEVKVGRKLMYKAISPEALLRRVRERMVEFELVVDEVVSLQGRALQKPKVYFLYGVAGFKELWDRILTSGSDEFCILTDGESFLKYVQEKYILANIITRKKKQNIKSRQLIVKTPYAERVAKKDISENRQTKFLPSGTQLPFTEIICKDFVAFFSSRAENFLMVIESHDLAKSRKSIFDVMWNLVT